MKLELPVDFESESGFRALTRRLNQAFDDGLPMAYQVYLRLWVDLARDARTTNRPGFLSDEAAEFLTDQLDRDTRVKPGDYDWLQILTDAQILARDEANGGYLCQSFVREGMNRHHAGDFVPRERMGAIISAHERNKRQMQKDSETLTMSLLSVREAAYKDQAGNELTPEQVTRAINIIRTLDNCLGYKPRGVTQASFPEGVVASASAAIAKYGEGLEKVYRYILKRPNNPAVPRTAEQCLRMIDQLISLAYAG